MSMDSAITEDELTKLRLSELKKLCTKYNLPSTGTKTDLVTRLMENKGDSFTILQPGDEAKLLGDVDDDSATFDLPVTPCTGHVLDEPTNLKSTSNATPVVPSDAVASLPRVPVGLKRPSADLVVDVIPSKQATESQDSVVDAELAPDNVSATVTQGTEDKLAVRANRFGLSKPTGSTPLGDDKLVARALRFGLPVGEGGAGLRTQTPASTEDSEKLRKRAERFGQVSNVKEDEEERKASRLKRFGAVVSPDSNNSTGIAGSDAQKAARAERFGIETDSEKLLKRKARFGLA